MFTTDSMPIIHKLYTKLYPTEISDSEILFTFKSILLLLGMENSQVQILTKVLKILMCMLHLPFNLPPVVYPNLKTKKG